MKRRRCRWTSLLRRDHIQTSAPERNWGGWKIGLKRATREWGTKEHFDRDDGPGPKAWALSFLTLISNSVCHSCIDRSYFARRLSEQWEKRNGRTVGTMIRQYYSSSTTSWWLRDAANWAGLSPELLHTLGSAPCSSNNRTAWFCRRDGDGNVLCEGVYYILNYIIFPPTTYADNAKNQRTVEIKGLWKRRSRERRQKIGILDKIRQESSHKIKVLNPQKAMKLYPSPT